MWADCHLTFLLYQTCILYSSSFILYSCFPFSFLYLSFMINIICILVLFSFHFISLPLFLCLILPLVSPCQPYLSLSSLCLSSSYFSYFIFFFSFFFFFPPSLSHPLHSDIFQSLPPFLPPSYTLYLPNS